MNRRSVSAGRSLHVVARLAGCAALVTVAAGCDPCLTSERRQVTLTASLSLSGLSSARSEVEPLTDEFATWTAAIANASSVPAGFGVVALQPNGAATSVDGLLVSLPFPLSSGQSLPVASAVATQGRGTFTLVAPNDPNAPLPADAVGLWVISGTTPEDLLADREQAASGTVTVLGVSPPRLKFMATVSYGGVMGRPSVGFSGELELSMTETSMCAG